MKFIETLQLALAAIWAHKLRSALTLLGMIIGVTAVVVVVSLIQGFNAYFDEKIAGIGSKSFTVFRFDFFKDFRNTDTIAAAQRRNKELTIEDFYYLRDHAALVDEFGAVAAATFSEIKRGGQGLEAIPVSGTTANMADIGKLDIAGGRYFTKTEEEAGMRLAFLGADVADKLFPAGNAVGEEIYVAGLPYRVVGVAEAKGPSSATRRTPTYRFPSRLTGATSARSSATAGSRSRPRPARTSCSTTRSRRSGS